MLASATKPVCIFVNTLHIYTRGSWVSFKIQQLETYVRNDLFI